jgi:ribonuclease-3 family protein
MAWFLLYFLAEYQSQLLEKLRQEFELTQLEQQVLARGRNATTKSKNRRNPVAYQNSTAFEALIGYLFTTDIGRCQLLLQWLHENLDGITDVDDAAATAS